jgi:hypothetical protein
MGLTTWKNSPQGKILKSDVTIAKNYLNQEEVSKLDRLVNMFIDFAELRVLNRQIMTMKDWLKQIEKFLSYTDQLEFRASLSEAQVRAYVKTILEDKNFLSEPKKYVVDREARREEQRKRGLECYPQDLALEFFIKNKSIIKQLEEEGRYRCIGIVPKDTGIAV